MFHPSLVISPILTLILALPQPESGGGRIYVSRSND
jgi:hypothetical protein